MSWLSENWSILLGSAGFTALIGQVYKFFMNRASLIQTRPKVAAETIDLGLASQARVINNLNSEIARLSKSVDNLVRYTRRTAGWHTRHIPFDLKAKEVIGHLAPDQVDLLPAIEPFPAFIEDGEEEEDAKPTHSGR